MVGVAISQTVTAWTIDALLSAETTLALSEMGGYAAGSDLVHGMILNYGAEAVLNFMMDVPAGSTADGVRAMYIGHFGSSIDDDYSSFKRDGFDAYTLAEQGCGAARHRRLHAVSAGNRYGHGLQFPGSHQRFRRSSAGNDGARLPG